MALQFNGTSSKLQYSGQIVTSYPFSIFAWIKPANITSGMMVAGVGDFGATDELAMYADGSFTGDPVRAFSKAGVGSVAASSPISMQVNVWKPALVVFTSATSRRAYLDTGDGGGDTTSNSPAFASFDRFVIGCRPTADSLFFSGSIAHCAVWNRALNRADFELLAKGFSPEAVSTANLIDYWPLSTSAATQVGVKGTVLTASNTTTGADSPTIVSFPVSYKTLNAIWTWYTDPRAVEYNGSLYIGSVNTSGSISIQKINLTTLTHDVFYLAPFLEADDHDNAAILILPDGRIVCFYCKHNDTVARYRVSTNPEDVLSWGAEQTFAPGSNIVSYSNPFILSSDPSKIWDFYRDGSGGTSNSWLAYRTTTNLTAWDAQVRIYTNGAVTPYYKFASNNIDRIDFCVTDLHPVQGQSSLYHFYMQLDGSNVPHYYKSDGTEITAPLPFGPSNITKVYDGSTIKGWNWQITLDTEGKPRIIGTRYPGNDGTDIRYMYWRWSGSAWIESEITADGAGLFSPEVYYAGGICFDGNNPNAVFLSKPVSGVREIQKWESVDNGTTWSKVQDITTGTVGKLNARPFSPKGYNRVPVLFWSGTYTSFTVYNTDIIINLNDTSEVNSNSSGNFTNLNLNYLSGEGITISNSTSSGIFANLVVNNILGESSYFSNSEGVGSLGTLTLSSLFGDSNSSTISTSAGFLQNIALSVLSGNGSTENISLSYGDINNINLNTLLANSYFTSNSLANATLVGIQLTQLQGSASLGGLYPSTIQDIGLKELSLASFQDYSLNLIN